MARKNSLARIRWLLLDVDGVLTDGSLLFDSEGRELKSFCAADGLGLSIWRKSGLSIGLLTARRSRPVEVRARELGVDELHQGCKDKLATYEDIKARRQLEDDQIAYMGDDLTDLPALRRAGFSAAPRNAVEEVRRVCHHVTSARGGHGAVRETIELILKEQGRWQEVLERFGR